MRRTPAATPAPLDLTLACQDGDAGERLLIKTGAGKVLWEEFFSNRDWPVASAVAVILLLILVIPIILFQRNEQRQREAE